jgi:hypothetical protein
MRNKLWIKLKNKYNLTAQNELYLFNLYKNNIIFKYKLPAYIEVDYFTLSIVVIKNIHNFYDINFFFRKFLSFFFFRQYNWKWISS